MQDDREFVPAEPTSSPASSPATPTAHERLTSIDLVRGLVMAVMALDHVRNYFPPAFINETPVDPPIAVFLTRWVTHFCAPAFFLLAGVGAYLSASRGKSRGQLAWFLVTRGLALIVIDVLVVRVGWDFNFDFANGPWFIVLTTIGASMIVLAGLIYLPMPAILIFSVAVIVGHNWFDWLDEEDVGKWEPLLALLHIRQTAAIGDYTFYVSYPLIPWVAVMSLGYCLGPTFQLDRATRRRRLFLLGFAITAAFLLLRALGTYGDSNPWFNEEDGLDNVMAFLHTRKYPASLHYVLMTLGPILLTLACLESAKGKLVEWLLVFGRTPLFFYVLHLYVIHALAVAAGTWLGFGARAMCVPYPELPENYGFHLWVAYALTLVVLAICYPACRWYENFKKRNKSSPWLSYL